MDLNTVAALGGAAGAVAVVLLFLKFMTDDRKATRESQEKRDLEFAKALNKLTESNREIAKEEKLSRKVHERGLDEAEKRNGHLAELQLEGKASNDKNSLAILEAITKLKTQHIDTQLVDKQTVKK